MEIFIGLRIQGGVPVVWISSPECSSGIQFLREFVVGFIFDLPKVREIKKQFFDLSKAVSKSFKKQPSKKQLSKKLLNNFFIYNIKLLNLSLTELKLIAKSRSINGYVSLSKEKLLSALNESESVESKNNFDDARIEKIKKDFNELKDRFSKPKIKKIRRGIYEKENKKNLSKSKKSSRLEKIFLN